MRYIYRPYSVLGAAIVPPVNCGEHTISIGPGGYHLFKVEPGPISCNSYSEASSEVKIDVKGGQEYYVKERIGWGVLQGRVHLELVNADAARDEIQACSRQ